MGVNLKDIIPQEAKEEVGLTYFKSKTIAIDAYNAIYQFLSIIRQIDGTPLKDFSGRITSHLSGLFYRTVNFMENNIKAVYVFDGKPPQLKELEITIRKERKVEATKKYLKALRVKDLKLARTYAQQTAQLDKNMVEESKDLLNAMGIPWVQAPSEGEAQASFMAKKGDVWAAASQDYDSLLFGATKLVRNLTISGRRKLPRKKEYKEIKPEIIYLKKLLEKLEIDREHLIDIAILIGTDYNPNGLKGIGPKKALRYIRKYKDLEKVIEVLNCRKEFPVDPLKIKEIFLNPKVTYEYKLKWNKPNRERVIEILCEEHNFSTDRVTKALNRAIRAYEMYSKQTNLERWFKR